MKKNIAIVMGGYSTEAEISKKSGTVVFENISRDKFNPYKIIIEKDRWYAEIDGKKFDIDKNDFSISKDGEKIKFDVVYNAIHGSPGEDGKLSAYFELVNIPHNTCDSFESALSFSKRECISVAKSHGVVAAESIFLSKNDIYNIDDIATKVGLPCMVKPNRAGSSFGISKVDKLEDLQGAIDNAFSIDNQLLIEEFITGTEVTVGVIPFEGKLKVLPMTEIVSHNSFFDYNAKYEGASDEITPARISEEDRKTVTEAALKVYKALDIKGFSRAEYIIKEGIPYFIEINTIPGLTEESILPQQAKAAGISLTELFESSINEALNR
ncbi:MAG: D-alanine--D-alanine ligase [Bacteroidota bacterium]